MRTSELRSSTPPASLLLPLPQVTISLLQRAMDESGKHKFLIDGFPRNEENRASFEKQVGAGLGLRRCGWVTTAEAGKGVSIWVACQGNEEQRASV